MWAKFTQLVKQGSGKDAKDIEHLSASQHGDVLNKVIEQHPNLSMFHTNESGVVSTQPETPAPPSPSVHSKRNMFKRLSKPALREELDAQRAPSPSNPVPSIPKKVRGHIDLNHSSNAEGKPSTSQTMPRRSSFDMLRESPPRPSFETSKSVRDTRRRPSLDLLRHESSKASQDSIRFGEIGGDSEFLSPGDKFNSKRSILRGPNTPGTGQNVRFFPRDDFKVITPDQSLSTDVVDKPQPPLPKDETPFLDRLARVASSDANSPESITRSSSSGSRSRPRPSVTEIFSSFNESEAPAPQAESSDMSLSFTQQVADNSNLFDMSQQLEIPTFPPPGLDFDVNASMFEPPSLNTSTVEAVELMGNGDADAYPGQMTSTPAKPKDTKGKGKEKAVDDSPEDKSIDVAAPRPEIIDETIFHAKERSPKFAAPLHERSHSFSLGQTLYYSLGNSSNSQSEAAYPSSDLKGDSVITSSAEPTPPPPPPKSRSRALSDTVFQSMLASSNKAPVPEADINDESTSGLVVYSGGPVSEPDPFSANANTYYTPQMMIPTTPPKGIPRHNRKTSKEESLIISLQTQLALRTEMCSQYEADLKARDELVDILNQKLNDFEKDDAKKKGALRSWKKKVQELEKACRQLEEAVEDSRQESLERSALDEASSEALRMLHRQIASLEREKTDWLRREQGLREEVETLEGLVKERSEDIMQLKESLWNRDESERELKEGIREAKEQIDMMGNISVGFVDEEELKRLLAEKEQKTAEETQRFRTIEFALKQEVEELKMKYEGLEVSKANCVEQLEEARQQLRTRDEEYATLKAELEAQWEHTEKATDKILVLEREKTEVVSERDSAKTDLEEMGHKLSNMETEWNEAQNKREEIEAELQEVWTLKDELERERDELDMALLQEREHTDNLTHELQQKDNQISELEHEQQFAKDNVTRLEQNIRQRDEEITQLTRRIRDAESELEQLREELSSVRRKHQHLVNEQSRALEEVTGQQDQVKAQMDDLVRAKAEVDLELKTSKERVNALKDEVERLRRHNHTLQQESADKEVKIVQLGKIHAQDKEDMAGLNIALDSKQQELELLKRKLGLRGTAGSTPAQPSKTSHRRDSSIFSATPLPRPPSAMSESGTDSAPPSTIKKKSSSETSQSVSASASGSAIKISALGKSSRVNATGLSSTTSSAVKARPSVDNSMGPPALKSRPSITGTPTPSGRLSSLGRSSSARVSGAPAAPLHAPHRRVSSTDQAQTKAKASRAGVMSPPPSSVQELDEKENVDSDVTSPATRRRSLIPTLG
ncbi:hypothetical protein CVT26_010870 [Gymnopilus dilepis]|uniref:Uncharacterized protein n=1 Tax=Gymnopilus dilepis TaxID=231916 RepID=A0A409VIV3_9AGAR|nr:hypothetical protein CVT26_010870 [Gymnopilus dilepis]